MAAHVEAMVGFMDAGAEVFDYGNSIRGEAQLAGYGRAFDFPGFVPAYVRPLFCRGIGPFRWVALSGDPEDIYKTDQRVKELIPDDPHLHRWLDMARERIAFQGLPARICWVGLGQRHRLGQPGHEARARLDRHQDAALGVQVVHRPAPGAGDHRQADRHGLQHHRAAAFDQARQDQHVGLPQEPNTFVGGAEARELDRAREAEPIPESLERAAHRPGPDQEEPRRDRRINLRPCFQQEVDPLPVD